jgi:hypothetical protein
MQNANHALEVGSKTCTNQLRSGENILRITVCRATATVCRISFQFSHPNGTGIIFILLRAALAVSAALSPVILQASSYTIFCNRGAYSVALAPKLPIAAAAQSLTLPFGESSREARRRKVSSLIFSESMLTVTCASFSAAETSPLLAKKIIFQYRQNSL